MNSLLLSILLSFNFVLNTPTTVNMSKMLLMPAKLLRNVQNPNQRVILKNDGLVKITEKSKLAEINQVLTHYLYFDSINQFFQRRVQLY